MNWKPCGRERLDLNFYYYPDVYLGNWGWSRIHKSLYSVWKTMCETGKRNTKQQNRQCAYEYHETLLLIGVKPFTIYTWECPPCVLLRRSQQYYFYLFSNDRYVDCLSLPYATNKSKKLKLHYKYCSKREKHDEKRRKGKTITVNIKVLMISNSHNISNRVRNKVSFPSFIFWPPNYRSHSVLLDNAVHCPRWFLSMGSWRLRSM